MVEIKDAEVQDLDKVCSFIHELAEYEKLSEDCIISETELGELMFTEQLLHALIIYDDGKAVGFATYLYMISTFKAKKILYIEDLFVRKTERGAGFGKALIEKLETDAKESDCAGMEWKCLKWNKPSQKFYEKFGGKCDCERLTYFKEIVR